VNYATIMYGIPATSTSILQRWVEDLPIRYQGTLLTAMRGCDSVPREDVTKILMRGLRHHVLNPADARELSHAGGFMSFNLPELIPAINKFKKSMDHYPLHFVMHLLHAIEVIGYEHPMQNVRDGFSMSYYVLVHALHLMPETREALRERMLEDRIKTGNL